MEAEAFAVADAVGAVDVPERTEASSDAVRGGRVRRALGRAGWWALTCPAFWLCLIGGFFYCALAVDKVDQHIAGSFDFGVIFQVIHGWAFHGYPSEPLGAPQVTNEWGDHFAPILVLLAPLLWIRDSPAVIAVAQAVLICSAGLPIYYAVRRLQGPAFATVACVFYLSCIEVQNAIGFDIHENMFEPLLIAVAIERALAGKWTIASIAIGATLFCYEDMGSMVLLFGLWAAWHRKWRHAAALCVLGPAMIYLYTGVIVPDWGHDLAFWQARHFDYLQSLGASTMSQALAHAAEHPQHFLALLVDDPTKIDTWLMLLAPVGFLCLASPITYLGATEVVLLMVSDNDTHWSTHYHFYLQVAPIIIIGAADGLRRIGLLLRILWRRMGPRLPDGPGWLSAGPAWRVTAVLLAVLAVGASVRMEMQTNRDNFSAAIAYLDGKYSRTPQVDEQIAAIADVIPPNVDVYVSNDLGTVVLTKDTDVAQPSAAEYAFFDLGSKWTPPAYQQSLEQSLEQQGFHVFAEDGQVILMWRPRVSSSSSGTLGTEF
ncbi:MAG TPA: DUF2079 domain-containing protein [Actinospica sp.]|nr:DUF2079 domain-containing protein [Actinospica sp.]